MTLAALVYCNGALCRSKESSRSLFPGGIPTDNKDVT
ncbi:Uncharacterised protein [Serratia proteamaculans]|nr:Uncharacterised protein [Serratia proteamaculans]CAI1728613.1 Uncharacterised protein [Serratia proteamaculans]CAI1739627.1 Uncharacterised protein [Serratia proteamaculans]